MGKNNQPNVYIILLNWNGYELTKDCILSLLNIEYANYQIVVVDNGSEDDSYSKLCRKFEDKVKFISNKTNLGFTGGNNVGIKYAVENNADYVLVLNNDTIVDKPFLNEMIKIGESKPEIGILGSKIYYFSDPDIIWFSGGSFNKFKCATSVNGMGIKDNGIFDKLIDVDYITGCALLVKSAVIDKIGHLNEDYFNYAEDADFCFRAKKAGYRVVFVPTSKIWHKVASSMKGNYSPFYLYFQSKNRLFLVKKNFSKIYLFYCMLVHFLCYIPGKLFVIWFRKENKLKASFSLLLGTYDFLASNKEPRFLK